MCILYKTFKNLISIVTSLSTIVIISVKFQMNLKMYIIKMCIKYTYLDRLNDYDLKRVTIKTNLSKYLSKYYFTEQPLAYIQKQVNKFTNAENRDPAAI